MKSALDRFQALMGAPEPTGCRRYLGFCRDGGEGYGSFWWDGLNIGAHVASYRLFCGEVPHGEVVRHTCDHQWCIEPTHLVAGTQVGNMADCVQRGRIANGARQHLAVMTWERVRELRARYAAGATQMSLAADFGISQPTVSQIVRSVTWREEVAA